MSTRPQNFRYSSVQIITAGNYLQLLFFCRRSPPLTRSRVIASTCLRCFFAPTRNFHDGNQRDLHFDSLLFRAILVSNNHCSKNKSFNLLFHQVVYAMNTLSARYLKQYYPERIIVDQTVSFRFMTTNRKID